MMIRRCLLGVSSGRSGRWMPSQITTQIPSFLSSRKEFSAASQPNAFKGYAPPEKPSGSGNISKVILAGVALGTAIMTAYQTGYIGPPHVKEENSSLESSKFNTDNKNLKDIKPLEDPVFIPSNGELSSSSSNMEDATNESEAHPDFPYLKNLQSSREGESQVEGGSNVALPQGVIPDKEGEILETSSKGSVDGENLESSIMKTDKIVEQNGGTDHHDNPSETSSKGSVDGENFESSIMSTDKIEEQNGGTDRTPIYEENDRKNTDTIVEQNGGTDRTPVYEENDRKDSLQHLTSNEMPKDELGEENKLLTSLSDAYLLREIGEASPGISLNGEATDGSTSSNENKAFAVTREDFKDAYISKGGKLVLDFIEAIHAAEKKQAELDARIYNEEKRMLKEKYEKDLKNARARELMYAEEAALLDKELTKERAKAIATIKSLQEKTEEKLKVELQHKEDEAKLELKKAQELAKAELAAAIGKEKSSQIEKMADANLHINALCMAFMARSEEARQSHSAHNLAVGALALEDALSKGLPIQAEIDSLYASLEGIEPNSLLDFVFSSLPRETLISGIDTPLQLIHKFDELKGKVRHFSLIPFGGGGMLAHAVAHIASSLKLREEDQSGDGIESVINQVEYFLSEGKLAEAADALEGGVHGSQAEVIIGEWVKQARNRAIMEQALSLLQSYAISVSIT
ncbi:MICOS complex subunit [Tasmannia lanceolata]|uniref:MICOS complex subunit n=1 Tax=Tasmannia lanceolata TaxID=3420 RepID=UPI004062E972